MELELEQKWSEMRFKSCLLVFRSVVWLLGGVTILIKL